MANTKFIDVRQMSVNDIRELARKLNATKPVKAAPQTNESMLESFVASLYAAPQRVLELHDIGMASYRVHEAARKGLI